MRRSFVALTLSLAALSWACSEPATITQPGPLPSPALTVPPVTVRIDGLADATAIAGVSDVRFDATQMAADNVRTQIQFGDGESVASPVATHVYRTSGTFHVTVTVTDAAGRQASHAETVVVETVHGGWFQAGINPHGNRFESRRLTVTSQDGAAVRGIYAFLGEADRGFTGHVTVGDQSRRLTVTADDGSASFAGALPARLDARGYPLEMAVVSGAAAGQSLAFRPLSSDAAGPPPRTHLVVSSMIPNRGNFTDTGIYEGWESTFDASESSGDDLQYFIEFGDGEAANAQVIDHAIGVSGPIRARVIVIDRFGRVASETQNLYADAIANSACYWGNDFRNPGNARVEFRLLRFVRQEGDQVTGLYRHPEGWESTFSGTLSGHSTIRLRLDDGTIDLAGTFEIYNSGSAFSPYLVFHLRGGSADGATLEFHQGGTAC